jgi:hypothetical protein
MENIQDEARFFLAEEWDGAGLLVAGGIEEQNSKVRARWTAKALVEIVDCIQ